MALMSLDQSVHQGIQQADEPFEVAFAGPAATIVFRGGQSRITVA